MGTYVLLLDQIFPFLESQFSALPIDLQNKLTQEGIEKPNIVISADVSKWDKLPKLQREYSAALYDFHYSPNHRRKAASEKLIESITPYLETKFSDLPQQMKMNIPGGRFFFRCLLFFYVASSATGRCLLVYSV